MLDKNQQFGFWFLITYPKRVLSFRIKNQLDI